MESIVDSLEQIESLLAVTTVSALDGTALGGLTADELIAVMQAAARISRRAEAIMIEGAAQVDVRSDAATPRDERLTTVLGCRSVGEVIQRVTGLSSRRSRDLQAAGSAVIRRVAPSSGMLLPAEFSAMRAGLVAGDVGLDGLVAVIGPLQTVATVAGRAAHSAADQELAAAARGAGADAAPPATAEELRVMAQVWAIYFDQDGAEPREVRAERKRGIRLGVSHDGTVAINGHLLAEVAAQLQQICHSLTNPKVNGVPVPGGPRFADAADAADPDAPLDETAESRSRPQLMHDALAAVLSTTAASGVLPTIGGSAPTLVVSVRHEDLVADRGYAHIGGLAEPVSLAAARHVACTGAIERVVHGHEGRIVAISTTARVFNAHQRRAITLRDGGCLIPGCHVPAEWCEVHHVEEHSRGGPTHTDNGVLLCWHHHRTLDTGGWQIRMNLGVPEVRGPAWWDSSGRWRAVTKSPTRMRERADRRAEEIIAASV